MRRSGKRSATGWPPSRWSAAAPCCPMRSKGKAEQLPRQDKEEAVSNIIVALELGGTKDTLEKMLAELAAKVKGA